MVTDFITFLLLQSPKQGPVPVSFESSMMPVGGHSQGGSSAPPGPAPGGGDAGGGVADPRGTASPQTAPGSGRDVEGGPASNEGAAAALGANAFASPQGAAPEYAAAAAPGAALRHPAPALRQQPQKPPACHSATGSHGLLFDPLRALLRGRARSTGAQLRAQVI